jgi:hypothetical protein
MIGADVGVVLPELILAVASMGLLMAGAFGGEDRIAGTLTYAMAALLAALGLLIGLDGPGRGVAFNGAFVSDGFARFAKVLILFASSAMLALSKDYFERRGLLKFEFPVLIGLAVLGMLMMVSAGDLMALYVGLELQSLALYVVPTRQRPVDRGGAEIFRARRLVLGSVALRRVADLRLHRLDAVRRDRGGGAGRGHGARAAVRRHVHGRRACVQDFRGAVSHVDPRRL